MITGERDRVLTGAMSYGTLVKQLKDCGARHRARFQHDVASENALVHPGEFMSDRHQPKTVSDASVEASGNEEGYKKNSEQVPAKDCKYEVGIIFDSSGSLMQNFQRQLSFANQLVDQMPIADNATRVRKREVFLNVCCFQVGIIQFAGKTKTRVLVDFR